jgi:hypothetical protein
MSQTYLLDKALQKKSMEREGLRLVIIERENNPRGYTSRLLTIL